uniref:Reverse transcriptase domain-containing protein n=1 Tax=Trichuris muris TaxID=70415 RepID=A0A5S6QKA5_TRIMR
MGSPLSPVLAEVFMEHLEEVAFEHTAPPAIPKVFKRYVDDIFAILEVGTEEDFLQHLNNSFPGVITLTMEKEKRDCNLDVIDFTVTLLFSSANSDNQGSDNRGFTVYRSIYGFHLRADGSRRSTAALTKATASSDQLRRLPSARWDERVG